MRARALLWKISPTRARFSLELRFQPSLIPIRRDVGTAELLQSLGFRALAATSAGFTFSQGPAPDGNVSFEAMIAHCRRLSGRRTCQSRRIWRTKGDSPESATETVFAAAAAGLAGCSLEDFSGDEDRPIYEFSHAVEDVRRPRWKRPTRALKSDFVFTAAPKGRNFLHGVPDLDDTIRRLQASGRRGRYSYASGGSLTSARCARCAPPANRSTCCKSRLHSCRSPMPAQTHFIGSKLTCAFGAVERAAKRFWKAAPSPSSANHGLRPSAGSVPAARLIPPHPLCKPTS